MWVSRAKLNKMKQCLDKLTRSLERASRRPYLLEVRGNGDKIDLLFVKNNKVFVVKVKRDVDPDIQTIRKVLLND